MPIRASMHLLVLQYCTMYVLVYVSVVLGKKNYISIIHIHIPINYICILILILIIHKGLQNSCFSEEMF